MRATVILVVGSLAALVLQLVVAPNIAIMGAMPNFMLVYAGVSAMLHQGDASVVAAFASGFVFDLATGGTLGVMAALLTLAAFAASKAGAVFGSDTLGVSLVASMMCSLIVEVLYALFYVVSAGVPVFDALFMRALPCALFDCAMGLIVFPLITMIFSSAGPQHVAPTSSTIRLR